MSTPRHNVDQTAAAPAARGSIRITRQVAATRRESARIGPLTGGRHIRGLETSLELGLTSEWPTNHPELDPSLPAPGSLVGSATLTSGASGYMAASIMEMVTDGPVLTFRLTLMDLG